MSVDLCDSEVGVFISSRLKALLPHLTTICFKAYYLLCLALRFFAKLTTTHAPTFLVKILLVKSYLLLRLVHHRRTSWPVHRRLPLRPNHRSPLHVKAESPSSHVEAESPSSRIKAESPSSRIKAESPSPLIKAESLPPIDAGPLGGDVIDPKTKIDEFRVIQIRIQEGSDGMDPVLYYTNTKGYKPVLDMEITFSACTRPWGVEEVRSDAEIVSKLQTVVVFVTRATTEHGAQAFINELPFSLILRFYSQGFQAQWPFVQLVIKYLQSDSRLIKSLEKIDPNWYAGLEPRVQESLESWEIQYKERLTRMLEFASMLNLDHPHIRRAPLANFWSGLELLLWNNCEGTTQGGNSVRRLVETAKRCKDLPMKVRPRKD
ncbi:hypothetical protein EV360DRAFT_72080 [Lentinula raphanica]|nr:hypothetical protein EV360DRAFT_72080 [Lentinula raphanica]